MEPFVESEEPKKEVQTLSLEPKMIWVEKPPMTGNACAWCGGVMVRTGACECCSECGTSGGCS